MPQNFWLFKSDPDEFGWDDLVRAPKQTTGWDGIRNAEARNLLRDRVQAGDRVLIYHTNGAPSAIVGVAEVVRAGHPDPTQFEEGHDRFDAKSSPARPLWFMVDLRGREPLPRPVTLDDVKAHPALANMTLLKRGRLSIQPVTPAEWKTVMTLAGAGGRRRG